MADRFTAVNHLIDCDTKPLEPDGLTVAPDSEQLPSRVKGVFRWNGKVGLYLSEPQQQGKLITGHKLKEELSDKPVLPANVLDYLLAHPHLIPNECVDKVVFFWGTVYRDADGYLYVRYLYRYDGRWSWHYGWLDDDWGGSNPAALRA